MGCNMNQVGSEFTIKAEHRKAVFKAIQGLTSKPTILPARPGQPARFSFVEIEEIEAAKTLEELFEVWFWEIEEQDQFSDITGIDCTGEKLGDDALFFRTIAPFVKAGSYIEMTDDEGDRWRWVFDGKTCKEVQADIVWIEQGPRAIRVKCPECGHNEAHVAIHTTYGLNKDGQFTGVTTDGPEENLTNEDFTQCASCDHNGPFASFEVKSNDQE